MAFATLILFEHFNLLNFKNLDGNIWECDVFANKWLWLAIISTTILAAIAIQFAPFNSLFHLEALSIWNWLEAILVASSILIFGEAFKFIAKKKVL